MTSQNKSRFAVLVTGFIISLVLIFTAFWFLIMASIDKKIAAQKTYAENVAGGLQVIGAYLQEKSSGDFGKYIETLQAKK